MAQTSAAEGALFISVAMEIDADAVGHHPGQPPFDAHQRHLWELRPHRGDRLLDNRARLAKFEPKSLLVGVAQVLVSQRTDATAETAKQRQWQGGVLEMDEAHGRN